MVSQKSIWIFLLSALLGVGVVVRLQNRPDSGRSNAVVKAGESSSSSRHSTARLAPPSLVAFGETKSQLAAILSAEEDSAAYKLSEQEVYEYLRASRTNAQSLLTAFEATHDREYLKLAAAKFPDDPLVQARVLTLEMFPDERAKWIEAFKKAAPGNSFANLLAAREAMQAGQVDAAMLEIAASRGKPFNDYTREAMVGLEEAYLSAGRAPAEAKALGSSEILLPQLAQFKELAIGLKDRALEAGKTQADGTQEKLLSAAWAVGERLRNYGQSGIILNDLVGLAVQNAVLKNWPANSQPDFLDRPVAEILSQNTDYRKNIRESTSIYREWVASAPEYEVVNYLDRIKVFGEQNALNWVRSRHPEIAPAQDKQ